MQGMERGNLTCAILLPMISLLLGWLAMRNVKGGHSPRGGSAVCCKHSSYDSSIFVRDERLPWANSGKGL
jgi:hypothetical protein